MRKKLRCTINEKLSSLKFGAWNDDACIPCILYTPWKKMHIIISLKTMRIRRISVMSILSLGWTKRERREHSNRSWRETKLEHNLHFHPHKHSQITHAVDRTHTHTRYFETFYSLCNQWESRKRRKWWNGPSGCVSLVAKISNFILEKRNKGRT